MRSTMLCLLSFSLLSTASCIHKAAAQTVKPLVYVAPTEPPDAVSVLISNDNVRLHICIHPNWDIDPKQWFVHITGVEVRQQEESAPDTTNHEQNPAVPL